MAMWNLQIKILFILGDTDNGKDGYYIGNSKSNMRWHNVREVYLGSKQLSDSKKLTV